jgi:hypothetical protein
MRTTLALLTATLLGISGCSTKTALDAFNMDSRTELAVTHLRTATVVKDSLTTAVISTVYLNRVYPERYNGDEYFFVALYRHDDAAPYDLYLNGDAAPVEIRELSPDEELCVLMPIQSSWNRYYLVRYPHQEAESLTLTLGNGQSGTGALDYQKDAQ